MSDVGRRDRLDDLRMGRRSSCRWRSRGPSSRVQREPLAVHPPTLVRAEERDRLGEVLGRGEGRICLLGVGLAHLRGEDRVDDDDVGGGAGALEAVGESQGPGLRRSLGRGVDRVVVGGLLGLLGARPGRSGRNRWPRAPRGSRGSCAGRCGSAGRGGGPSPRAAPRAGACRPSSRRPGGPAHRPCRSARPGSRTSRRRRRDRVGRPPARPSAPRGCRPRRGSRRDAPGRCPWRRSSRRRRQAGRRPPGRGRPRHRRRRSPSRLAAGRPTQAPAPAASPSRVGRASSAGCSFGFSCE